MFLPFYLPDSTLLRSRPVGLTALALWISGQVRNHHNSLRYAANKMQVFWLQQGYQLEFLGNSTFVPGLWAASILFFLVNVGILGIIIRDVAAKKPQAPRVVTVKKIS
jgi:phosphatidylinositol glycan class M